MSQSHAQIWLHVIFSTKHRKPFLRDKAFQEQMFCMLAYEVKEQKCVSASVGGHIDHVHLLVGLSRTLTIANFMERIKTTTSKWAKGTRGIATILLAKRLWRIFSQSLVVGQS